SPLHLDFQVTGISRSGRVRKKSSKLLDFESPEEIEKRTRRQSIGRQPSRYPGRGRPPNVVRELEPDQEMFFDEPNATETDTNHNATSATPMEAVAVLNSDDELDNLVQDLVEGVQAEATYQESSVRQSLYMREKVTASRRRPPVAKVITKEKGKQRFTAYSLWAREVRKKDFQDLDFSNMAKKLSEMWANVSNREKNAWRRKAKIQATRAKSRDRTVASPSTQTSNGSNSQDASAAHETSFQNRATTSRTRKLAADRQQSAQEASTSQRRSISTRSARVAKLASPTETETLARISGQQQQQLARTSPTRIEPIDAAAHLKLLGESLSVIGERLKKHNGHVALSGSLSVLLDSLLCSMGPLLCMTTQIPGLENKTQLSKNLANTLDNIAYVMPGL
ncbi:hypothetical protein KR009_000370, partial [Drosophila setifemur]